jgi:hypothetical protein
MSLRKAMAKGKLEERKKKKNKEKPSLTLTRRLCTLMKFHRLHSCEPCSRKGK